VIEIVFLVIQKVFRIRTGWIGERWIVDLKNPTKSNGNYFQ
jgi:hypothetical protein